MDEQITTLQGGRKAVSLGGAATGFGADLIVVDDLMKAADASSVAERQRVRNYYEQTLLSRLNDKADGRIVVIQQRLHEDDLPGHLIETGLLESLNLRAIAIADEAIPLGFGGCAKERSKDEALWPEREPLSELARMRIEMGAYIFSGPISAGPLARRRQPDPVGMVRRSRARAEAGRFMGGAELGYGSDRRSPPVISPLG